MSSFDELTFGSKGLLNPLSISNILVDKEVRTLYTSGNEKNSTYAKNTNTSEDEFEFSKERTSLRNTNFRGDVLYDERLMKYSTIKAEINSPKTVDITSFEKHGAREHATR